MDCVILIRLNSGAVVGILEEGRLATFPHMDDAVTFADGHLLCQRMPYQIVELDEL